MISSIGMVYEKLDDIGDLIPMDVFVDGCKNGPCFIDYDGYGYYAFENCQTKIVIKPSDVTSGDYDQRFSHVMWYNR